MTANLIPIPQVGPVRVLLTIHDMAAIYRESVPSIRRKLQAGTFQPEPWDKYPYRWNPADVERDLEHPRELRMRQHGRFHGGHRLPTAKVVSPTQGHRGRPRKKASSA